MPEHPAEASEYDFAITHVLLAVVRLLTSEEARWDEKKKGNSRCSDECTSYVRAERHKTTKNRPGKPVPSHMYAESARRGLGKAPGRIKVRSEHIHAMSAPRQLGCCIQHQSFSPSDPKVGMQDLRAIQNAARAHTK